MKNSTLIVSPSFAAVLEQLRSSAPQGILLHGAKGVGLLTIAKNIADSSALILQPLTKKGEVDAIAGTIAIEQIRRLYEQTRSGGVRYVIIDDADLLSRGAQNAFLKLLEEPGSNLHFILTSHRPERLLPTIRSRVTNHHVAPISEQQSKEIVASTTLSDVERSQALFLATGLPAELIRLSGKPSDLTEFGAVMADARQFLSGKTRYERLVAALRYTSSRTKALELTDAALRIVRHTLYRGPNQDTAFRANQLLAMYDALEHNANPKLQLVQFVLQ